MTDAERGKLDAFLKQAVANNRREPLIVMIRLAASSISATDPLTTPATMLVPLRRM